VPLSIVTANPANASVWIDFDQNGMYDTNEWTQLGTNIATGVAVTAMINIPNTAVQGVTGMRIRSNYIGHPNGADNACTTINGETEEYRIRIVPPCTQGPATPGIIVANTTTKICPGDTRTYTIAFAADADSYNWTAPDGGTITSGQGTNSVTVSYGAGFTANDTIRVTAVNACGNSLVSRFSRVYRGTAPATPYVTGNRVAGCGQTNVPYLITTPVLGYTYNWSWSDPLATITSGEGTGAINTDFASGFTTAVLSVTASNGCGTSLPRNTTVKNGPAPTVPAAVTGDLILSCESSVGSYAISVPIPDLTYNWSWNTPLATVTDGQGGSSINAEFASGYTTGILSVTATNACGTGLPRNVTVKGASTAPPDAIAGNLIAGCGNTNVPYSVVTPVPGMIYTWSWDSLGATGAVISSGQGSSSITVDYSTTFTKGILKVTATSPCGTSTARSVTVKKGPVPTVSSITGPNYGVCSDAGIPYTVSATSFTGFEVYAWSFADPAIATIATGQGTPSVTVDYAQGFIGIGYVQVSVTDGCGTSVLRKYAVRARPAKPSVPSGPDVVCAGSSHSYTSAPVYGALNYTWLAPAGSTINDGTVTSPTPIMITTSTSVTVNFGVRPGKVTMVANATCGSSVAASLIVDTSCGASKPAPEAIQESVVEVMEQSAPLSVELIPNPATDQVTVRIHSGTEGRARLRVLSLTGQQMMVEELASIQHGSLVIPVRHLAAGVYLVEVVAGGEKMIQRFVKQ
jgi:hypothetical protein